MSKTSLEALHPGADFVPRHLGPNSVHQSLMLEKVGVHSLEHLIEQVVPHAIRTSAPLALPPALSEREALFRLKEIAQKNEVYTSMIGMGYFGTITPPVILRNIMENPGWYTAYTPYQAEVSQGRLEALLNFQQMVSDLVGLPVANASLLDEGTAAAEAMSLAHRVGESERFSFFVDEDTHPQTVAVLKTRAEAFGFRLIVGDPLRDLEPDQVFAALFSYPGSKGHVRDYSACVQALHHHKALAIFATDLLALALLKPPGEMGADIAIGSAQRFGVPMGGGGPHAAFFAVRETYKRFIPGRIIGVSIDAKGRKALRMAMQTREQHIRREKATSNICTAQVLLAVISAMYAVYHGPSGILKIAQRAHRYAQIIALALRTHGFEIGSSCFFDTVAIHTPGKASFYVKRALEKRINLRLVDENTVGISCDETTEEQDVLNLLEIFLPGTNHALGVLDEKVSTNASFGDLERTSPFLTHPVFSLHHSETEMLRYLRRLQSKDISLDRSMIALGSCTMKLNATTEMIPVTWPEFAHIHPFAPQEQIGGYRLLFSDLEKWLAEITGFEGVSLQPNAGSQGEYAGLLAIKAYHQAQGQGQRDICLIPSSAHGTNPASAVMAGLRVVVVACDRAGNVDVLDLQQKAQHHKENLAALMITYPSTHGVFEDSIKVICEHVHACGGQVYLDGANLNALVGIVRPGEIGADVCHMNLHKTFCIPHGGGGPGVGPIGVKAHLLPFLPGHAMVPLVSSGSGVSSQGGQVSSAPWGSASILPISWAYIAMMGAEGLKKASQVAILNANYIARRLQPFYPVVYTGKGGYVAHECIIDLRPFKELAGITAEDVAKRLIDYGFHAPTMSWPVAETLMIEPTESENLSELDRFCDALIEIRHEIKEIEEGKFARDQNVLKGAPHTSWDLLASEGETAYSKQKAAFPLPFLVTDKYWPPVGRVDNVYGDRHLSCSCPPLEDYLPEGSNF